MGGAIKVIIKHEGIVHKQTRWTNLIPRFVLTDKFVEGDVLHIHDYLNAESAYSDPSDDFSPDGYGLLVFDFDAKRIYDCQGYTGLNQYDSVHLLVQTQHNPALEQLKKDPDWEVNAWRRMWDKKMLNVFQYHFNEPEIVKILELDVSFDEVCKIMSDHHPTAKSRRKFKKLTDEERIRGFNVKWKEMGWEYKTYRENAEGYSEYYEDIKSNYNLTADECKNWEEWIKNENS